MSQLREKNKIHQTAPSATVVSPSKSEFVKSNNMENIFNAQELQNIHQLIALYSSQLVKVKRDLARLAAQQAEFDDVCI